MSENKENIDKGPLSKEAIEKNPAHIALGIPKQSGAVSEGRTPIVIHGENNTINIIERQYNDKSAVDTVNALLGSEKENGETTKMIIENITKAIPMIMGMVKPVAPQQVTNSEPVKRAVKKAPVKKAIAKKSAPKKAVKKVTRSKK